jgi:hypothetical protein
MTGGASRSDTAVKNAADARARQSVRGELRGRVGARVAAVSGEAGRWAGRGLGAGAELGRWRARRERSGLAGCGPVRGERGKRAAGSLGWPAG